MDALEEIHIIRLSQGSKESLAFIHRLYRSRVFHYCLQLVRNHEVAEEITLDVFLKLWEKRVILEPARSVGGLLSKITRDYSISYLRKVARDDKLSREFISHYLQEQVHNPVEEQLWMKENLSVARSAIDSLPPRCKKVFQLRFSENFSPKEIAEEMQISINTVKKQLKKGTDTVREYLKIHADIVFCLLLSLSQLF